MDKFADDVDLITTLEYYDQIDDEMSHIAAWATENNLLLNKSKTKEIIFAKNKKVVIPPVVDGRERVECLKKLGVTLQSNLTMKDHVTDVISTCTNMVYALNMLRSHGLNQVALQQIFTSKILSKIMYASPAWVGLAGQEERTRINSFLGRSKRFGYYPEDGKMFEELSANADDKLFKNIESNNNHVLHHLLPEKNITKYNLRDRMHNYSLPAKDDRNFINRILYKNLRLKVK